MILYIASDSSYLSVSKSRSRVSGYHFLGYISNPNIPLRNQTIFHNTPIHIKASILRDIMFAASKSEIAVTFINTKLAILEHICLLEMGYPQPATLFEIDNTIAYGILTKQLKPKQTKAIDMQFYWLRDRSNLD